MESGYKVLVFQAQSARPGSCPSAESCQAIEGGVALKNLEVAEMLIMQLSSYATSKMKWETVVYIVV